jgi:YHS domain-containing protein
MRNCPGTIIFLPEQMNYRFLRTGVSGMATDPVCFAIVDEDMAQFRTSYKDKEYYFCTNYCKKQFLEDPQRYTRLNTDISIEPGGASC